VRVEQVDAYRPEWAADDSQNDSADSISSSTIAGNISGPNSSELTVLQFLLSSLNLADTVIRELLKPRGPFFGGQGEALGNVVQLFRDRAEYLLRAAHGVVKDADPPKAAIVDNRSSGDGFRARNHVLIRPRFSLFWP